MRKKRLIVCAVLVLGLLGFSFWRLTAPFRTIQQLEARYQQVVPLMSSNEVQTVMGFEGRWHTNGVFRGWDDIPGPTSTSARHAVAYTVPTFFLPVTFEFVFDENGKVVGKHRYD